MRWNDEECRCTWSGAEAYQTADADRFHSYLSTSQPLCERSKSHACKKNFRTCPLLPITRARSSLFCPGLISLIGIFLIGEVMDLTRPVELILQLHERIEVAVGVSPAPGAQRASYHPERLFGPSHCNVATLRLFHEAYGKISSAQIDA